MNSFVFMVQAEKKFLKLSQKTQERILGKLKELKNHPDIFTVLKKLIDFKPATHRLRIGNYRLILMLSNTDQSDFEFLILDAGHRKKIYE